ncbi:acyloxyacyl hydrolase [Tamlana fucoidanivorans]|nr:acyloxyacyl hydrolase [Tamlana fucoidanivorans]
MKKNITRTIKTILWITILIFSFKNYMYSQNDTKKGTFKTLTVTGHSGAHIYTGESLSEKLQYGYGGVNLKFSWVPNKEDDWSLDTGYAAYGIGFYTANIGDPEVFGNPHALFGFINFFLSKPYRRNVLELSPAFGLTYNLEPYNPETNPFNDAIGAKMAVYFSVDFVGAYKLNREIDLIYGVDFKHFSNGRTFTPNFGLNMFGFNGGMRYNFNTNQKRLDRDPYTTNVVSSRFMRPERPKTRKNDFNNSVDVYAALGVVQNEADKGTNRQFGTFSGTIDYRRYFNRMHGISAGLDFFFDNSLSEKYPETSDRFLLAFHYGYDFMFQRFDIRLNVGHYLTDDRGKGNFFLRPALQYEISKSFYAQFGLKTSAGAAADWIEFGVGIKPFKW